MTHEEAQKIRQINEQLDWVHHWMWLDSNSFLKYTLSFVIISILCVMIMITIGFIFSLIACTITMDFEYFTEIAKVSGVIFGAILAAPIIVFISNLDYVDHRINPTDYKNELQDKKEGIQKDINNRKELKIEKHNKSISGDIYHDTKPKTYNIDNVKANNNKLYVEIKNHWYQYNPDKSSIDNSAEDNVREGIYADTDTSESISYSDLANAKKIKGYVNDDKNTIDIQKLFKS